MGFLYQVHRQVFHCFFTLYLSIIFRIAGKQGAGIGGCLTANVSADDGSIYRFVPDYNLDFVPL